MLDLPSFLARQYEIAVRANGQQRNPVAVIGDVAAAMRRVEDDPTNLYAWVDVIVAAIEGGRASGATSFSLAQALTNRQAQMGARKYPPPLVHQVQMDARHPVSERGLPQPLPGHVLDEYGPPL